MPPAGSNAPINETVVLMDEKTPEWATQAFYHAECLGLHQHVYIRYRWDHPKIPPGQTLQDRASALFKSMSELELMKDAYYILDHRISDDYLEYVIAFKPPGGET